MSWSWTQSNAKPADVIERANEYFNQPYVQSMLDPEKTIANLVHQQIVEAAGAMMPGYLMNISAHGSQSMRYEDGAPTGQANNSLSVTIGYVVEPKPLPVAPIDPLEQAGKLPD